jgi:hypothetical protein
VFACIAAAAHVAIAAGVGLECFAVVSLGSCLFADVTPVYLTLMLVSALLQTSMCGLEWGFDGWYDAIEVYFRGWRGCLSELVAWC